MFIGPMWSGKTERLIEEIEDAEDWFEKVIVLKSIKDTRHHDDTPEGDPHLRTFSGKVYPCKLVGDEDIEDYGDYACTKTLVIVDEAQFFQGEGLVKLAEEFLVGTRGTLMVAGLDLTSEGEPFNLMPQIIDMAHSVTYLRAWCSSTNCMYPASRTLHIGEKGGDVKIGYAGYSPRCLKCWTEMGA